MYSPLAREYDLHRSALEQIYREYSELHHSKHKVLLTHNYRTHNEILKLPSKFFYRDKLRSYDTIKKHPSCKPLVLLKSEDKEVYLIEFKSYLNVKEAEKIVSFLKEKLLPNWPVAEWGQLKDNPNSIGILTTEYAQVHANILKATVKSFNYLGTLYPHLFEKRTNIKRICGHNCKCTRYVFGFLVGLYSCMPG